VLRPPCRWLRRLALIYIDEDGTATRTSFDEVADMSRRFANVLDADGLIRGDRVAVFLSQSLNCRSRIWRRFVPA
jgi:acyl-coenzyme A synthetase/AMP-(fatty) acid ligase